jgi:DNA-binding MarR family transcriptional regulator
MPSILRQASTLRRASKADERAAGALNSALVHLLRRVARDDDTTVGPAASSALSVLVFASADGARRLGDLARIERVSPATMSRVVDGLERAGFAHRRRDRTDRRQVWVEVTPAGRHYLRQGRARRVAMLTERLRRLTVAERELLARAAALMEQLASDD